MLNCESCQILMADAIYDEIDTAQERKLQEHVESCSACQAMFAELKIANTDLLEAGLSSRNFDDIPERASLDRLFEELEPNLDRIDAEKYRQLPKRNIAPWAAAITAIAASVIVFISLPSNLTRHSANNRHCTRANRTSTDRFKPRCKSGLNELFGSSTSHVNASC
jgi:hypothetical protein